MDLVVFGLQQNVQFFGLELLFLAEDVLCDVGENGHDVLLEGFDLGEVTGLLLVDECELLEEFEFGDDLIVFELAFGDLLQHGFDCVFVVFVVGEGSEEHVG